MDSKPNIKPYRRKPNFYETDAMGIIHHSNYIRWFEEARIDFMDQMGFTYARAQEQGIDIAVLDVYCQYKTMVRYGEDVDICVFVKSITPVKMVLGYEVKSAETGETKTTGENTQCFLDRETHGVSRLSKAIPELYELFLAQVKE